MTTPTGRGVHVAIVRALYGLAARLDQRAHTARPEAAIAYMDAARLVRQAAVDVEEGR